MLSSKWITVLYNLICADLKNVGNASDPEFHLRDNPRTSCNDSDHHDDDDDDDADLWWLVNDLLAME